MDHDIAATATMHPAFATALASLSEEGAGNCTENPVSYSIPFSSSLASQLTTSLPDALELEHYWYLLYFQGVVHGFRRQVRHHLLRRLHAGHAS